MSTSHEGQDLLYGADGSEGLAGCASSERGMLCWWRRNGALEQEEAQHRPFFLVSHPELLDDFKPELEITELEGENYYRFRARADEWPHHDAAVAHVMRKYRQHKADYPHEPILRFTDPINQYRLATGRTLPATAVAG